jgi:cation transport regulator ChaB
MARDRAGYGHPVPTDPADVPLPSTLQRSPERAQRTYRAALASAEETYDGDGEASRRVAFAAVKHSFEKVGDHWEAKQERGPSDAQAERSGAAARDRPVPTEEGVDANASKAHLMDLARRLDVRGRSSMTKAELVDALKAANRRSTDAARRR